MRPNRFEECGCCEVGVPPTPKQIRNRPSLPTIAYRVGTYASFRQAMIQEIAKTVELSGWAVRLGDDYGIAILEMWAYLADILTFYQERIANEAFLRTALHRDTIMRLASMLDYKLNPGLAATTHLAFILEDGARVNIPVGLRVQSVPGQDEKPQKFETVEAVTADSRLNRLRVFPEPQLQHPFHQGSSGGTIISEPDGLFAGDKLVIFDETKAELKEISDISVFSDKTILSWVPEIHGSTFNQFTSRIFSYDRRFRLFGYNAPASYLESTTGPSGFITWEQKTTDFSYQIPPEKTLGLEALHDDLKPNTKILIVQSASSQEAPSGFCRLATITSVTSQSTDFGPLKDTVTHISLDLGVQATPAVIQDSSGDLNIFTVGDDGALWTFRHTISGWGPWTSLGGRIDMLAVGLKDRRIEVVARGMEDKALWHIKQVSLDRWGEWVKLDELMIDRLTIGQNLDGRLEIFARGIDDEALWHMWQTFYDDTWSGWIPLGDRHYKIQELAMGQNADGRLEVFAIGTAKSLLHIWQKSVNTAHDWSWWSSLGGHVDMLAVGENTDGRLEVFARGIEDKTLWHIWQTSPNNVWSDWAEVGALQIDLLGVGQVVQHADRDMEVFARGLEDKALWLIWRPSPSSDWNDWVKVDEKKIDLMAVGPKVPLEIFACGEDRILQHYQRGPYQEPGWKSLGVLMWTISDRSQVKIFELSKASISFWSHHYVDTISDTAVYVPLDRLQSLAPGRSIILDDEQGESQTATVTAAEPIDTDGDGENDHLGVRFAPPLSRSLDSKTAILYGNVAKGTHGETVSGEILGSGDASKDFQSFTLKKFPTTFVPAPDAPRGAKNTLDIRVGGVLWKEVDSLYGRESKDEVYVTNVNDENEMMVQFGNGETGARLPTGQDNVAAKYRQGLGSEGNVRENSLTTLLDRSVGFNSVTNPRQAEGGTDPESLQDAIENAPNTVRTFERAISLRDYEDIARSYTGIAKARARLKLEDETAVIHLTVAGANGVKIEIGSETYKHLVRHLDLHRDSNHILQVNPHGNVSLVLKALIQVDPRHLTEDVLPAARRAILHYFEFDNLQLGQGIHLSDIYAVLQEVDGVKAAVVEKIDYRESIYPSLKPHLRIDPDKIASLEALDLIINADLILRG